MRRKRTAPKPPGWHAALIAGAGRLAPLQRVLNATPEAWGRKHIICACFEAGAIDGEQTTLLLQAYQLETA